MNPILLIVAVAVPLFLLMAFLALRQGGQIASVSEVEVRWQRVDMEAFLNLADPLEERMLRRKLSAAEFSRIHRMRIRAMWEYLGRLAFNSRLMMQAGQIVQHNSSGVRLPLSYRARAALREALSCFICA